MFKTEIDIFVDDDFTVDVVEDESSNEAGDLVIEEEKVSACLSPLKCECGCSVTPGDCDSPLDLPIPRNKNYEKLQRIREKKKKQQELKPIIKEMKEIVMQGSLRKNKLVCPACKYAAKRTSLFLSHLDAHLEFEKSLMCEHCDFVTFQKGHLSVHKARCSGATNRLCCTQCSFVTVKYSHLRKHLRRHEEGFSKRCRLCSFKTTDLDKLKEHQNKMHLSKYQCEECSFKTDRKREFDRHVKSHKTKEMVSRRTLLKCDLCDYESFYKRNVLQHRISHLELQ